ncbi:hypothetical protein KW797_02710 [Candidatus Parcubacteria bacterium]|nr:hypothetical protein [Candidatus Parcubacteria bacterium]
MRAPLSLRIAADFALCVGAFVLPWWALLIAGTVACFFFKNFYEFLAVALFLDFLYGAPGHAVFGVHFFVSAAALFCFGFSVYLKRRLSFYETFHA